MCYLLITKPVSINRLTVKMVPPAIGLYSGRESNPHELCSSQDFKTCVNPDLHAKLRLFRYGASINANKSV